MAHREGLMDLVTTTTGDIEANFRAIEEGRKRVIKQPQVITWFLPIVTHALKGGVRTVFAFSEYMSVKYGTLNVFVVYAYNGVDFDSASLSNSLRDHFPNLKFVIRKFLHGKDRVEDLPHSDISVCTLWTTAYIMLRYNQTARKFYFMQDFEPMFYAGGDLYMMIEQTYRLGYSCIANTPGVGNKYRAYSSDVVSFLPGIDGSVFYADPEKSDRINADGMWQIVFYGRPGNARNGFFLGAETLKSVKDRLGNKVRIISVGADWAPAEFGLEGVVENLGLLKRIEEVADLYRKSDLGLVFMATPHPSYQPLEYMACGCVVATNRNESNNWLLNANNSLLLDPIPSVAADCIVRLLQSPDKRRRLIENGIETVKELNWSTAFEVIETRMIWSAPLADS
ncbi:glycosyltransferase family 4 protein [Roseovarius sp. A21]|uniref:Glycosyltransferase family 4 protein n=1 Tax=Roseovarius bejariae TaxID=2576383 RepID=A0A844CZU4_9RHOB|nr:glycosyltransferase [Roseovarius bejariae]MRU15524.1 glycosyltransferase family 4 protein [Roseovarius bejariae]